MFVEIPRFCPDHAAGFLNVGTGTFAPSMDTAITYSFKKRAAPAPAANARDGVSVCARSSELAASAGLNAVAFCAAARKQVWIFNPATAGLNSGNCCWPGDTTTAGYLNDQDVFAIY